jgi:hypothetical protein
MRTRRAADPQAMHDPRFWHATKYSAAYFRYHHENIHPPLNYPRVAHHFLQEVRSWHTPERDGRGEAGVDDRHQFSDWYHYDHLGKYSSSRCIFHVFGNYIL